MLTVYKYPFVVDDYVNINMPKFSRVLSVQVQGVGGINDSPCIWAIVDTDSPLEVKRFRLVGTGHPIKEKEENLEFIGTFQLLGGRLVFHLFEIEEDLGLRNRRIKK